MKYNELEYAHMAYPDKRDIPFSGAIPAKCMSVNNGPNGCYAVEVCFFSRFNFNRLIVNILVYQSFRFVRSYVQCFFFVKILNKSNANIKVNTEKPFSKFV